MPKKKAIISPLTGIQTKEKCTWWTLHLKQWRTTWGAGVMEEMRHEEGKWRWSRKGKDQETRSQFFCLISSSEPGSLKWQNVCFLPTKFIFHIKLFVLTWSISQTVGQLDISIALSVPSSSKHIVCESYCSLEPMQQARTKQLHGFISKIPWASFKTYSLQNTLHHGLYLILHTHIFQHFMAHLFPGAEYLWFVAFLT